MQGPHRNAGRQQAIGGFGLGQCAFSRHLAVRGQVGRAGNAIQEMGGDLARTQFARADGAGEFAGFSEVQGGVLFWHGSHEKRKSFPAQEEPESVETGRQRRGRSCFSRSYLSDWPRVSGMRMKVISVMTAPAST